MGTARGELASEEASAAIYYPSSRTLRIVRRTYSTRIAELNSERSTERARELLARLRETEYRDVDLVVFDCRDEALEDYCVVEVHVGGEVLRRRVDNYVVIDG